MIQISRVNEVSKEALTPFAGSEFELGASVTPVSLLIWAVRDNGELLAYAGLRRRTLTSNVEATLLLCKGSEQRTLKLLRVLRRMLSVARTVLFPIYIWVRTEHVKFGRFLGFKDEMVVFNWTKMVM